MTFYRFINRLLLLAFFGFLILSGPFVQALGVGGSAASGSCSGSCGNSTSSSSSEENGGSAQGGGSRRGSQAGVNGGFSISRGGKYKSIHSVGLPHEAVKQTSENGLYENQ